MIRSRFVFGVGVLAVLVSSFPARASDKGNRIAVLIGVNRYNNRNFPDLEYAERDVEELFRVFSWNFSVSITSRGQTRESPASTPQARAGIKMPCLMCEGQPAP